jgi:hypothetical protein
MGISVAAIPSQRWDLREMIYGYARVPKMGRSAPRESQ